MEGGRDLDSGKVQAPCVVRLDSGGFRLFYTAVGPAKPFPDCQGYLLSAVSDDGLEFHVEPGIRLAPRPDVLHTSLRVLAPSVTRCVDGRWRLYFESRGPANQPTVICSAVSDDLLHWEHEEGIRLQSPGGLGGPRFLGLPDGSGRLYCCNTEYGAGGLLNGERLSKNVVSAVTDDGLHFEWEPGCRMRDGHGEYDEQGITAAEVIPPSTVDGEWAMVFSAWQDAPPGSRVPVHPSENVDAVEQGASEDFAVASIAADMAGFRSRILVARSPDGQDWDGTELAVEGAGYGGEGIDAVHAEDMALVEIGEGRYRMYYAACDSQGHWRIASAVAERIAAGGET